MLHIKKKKLFTFRENNFNCLANSTKNGVVIPSVQGILQMSFFTMLSFLHFALWKFHTNDRGKSENNYLKNQLHAVRMNFGLTAFSFHLRNACKNNT